MAAQFTGENSGGGGRSENLIGMNPAEADAMSSWAARFVAAAKESIVAAMREQQFPPPPPPPVAAALGGWSSNLGSNDLNTRGEQKKCELCNVLCTSPVMLAEHENGKRHQKKVQQLQKLEAVSDNADSDHPRTITVTVEPPAEVAANKGQTSKKKKGKKHAIKPESSKAEADGGDGEMEPSKKHKTEGNMTEMPFKCFMCEIKCTDKTAFDRHLCGKKHKSKVRSHWAKERPFLGLQAVYPQQVLQQAPTSTGE